VHEEPGYEPPHPNGSPNGSTNGGRRGRRPHAPWEFLILALLVALVCIGIVLAWTLVGSHSPERVDEAAASQVAAACDHAQSQLKALPNANPVQGADRVARIRAENTVFRDLVTRFAEVHPEKPTPATALQKWTADWQRMIDARAKYADDLAAAAATGAKVRFITPAVNAIKPVTEVMDGFVRENHPNLDACFTQALQLDTVEGPRKYEMVTS